MPWRPPRPQPHLVLRVLDDRGLPLPIHLLIPVLWLLGIRVRDMLWLVPVLGDQAWSGHCHAPPPPPPEPCIHLRLGVLRVINLGPLIPVIRFPGLGVLDLPGGQEVPVLLQAARFHPPIVDLHLIGVVRPDHQRVEVGELIILQGGAA